MDKFTIKITAPDGLEHGLTVQLDRLHVADASRIVAIATSRFLQYWYEHRPSPSIHDFEDWSRGGSVDPGSGGRNSPVNSDR